MSFSKFRRRYTFYFLGKQGTPDVLIILGGIGYGWIRQRGNELSKWTGFFYLLFCFFGVILTNDRGGVASFFILMIVLLSFDYKKLVIFLVLIGIGVYFTFYLDSLKGLQRHYKYIYDPGAIKRLISRSQIATFRSAWGMIKDHWLMGVGTNNFSKFARDYGVGRWYAYAHNFVLQFWAENGLFGMGFGLSIIGLVIYRWLKSWKKYRYKYMALGIGASFIGLLVSNLSNLTMYIIALALPFWLLAGIICSIYFTVKTDEEVKKSNIY
ncbi:MAG: O-antigen ligase family protein [Atribacterota bacterium]